MTWQTEKKGTCMGMSAFYGPCDDAESTATIHRALDLGVTLLDTADMYGPHTNERLVGVAIAGRREQVVLATKFGNVVHKDGSRGVNGTLEYVRSACEGSLQRLGVDHIDLYYQHRVDRARPSRRPSAPWPSWSPRARSGTSGCRRPVRTPSAGPPPCTPSPRCRASGRCGAGTSKRRSMPTARELGIGIVAYSPLGRGFLTGAIVHPGDLADDDFRKTNPGFAEDAFAANMGIVRALQDLATDEGMSAAQLALAWVARGPDVLPIPGTRHCRSTGGERGRGHD
jgi:aryl-alcohol dehydrogenase-like predicted oxidoreductase